MSSASSQPLREHHAQHEGAPEHHRGEEHLAADVGIGPLGDGLRIVVQQEEQPFAPGIEGQPGHDQPQHAAEERQQEVLPHHLAQQRAPPRAEGLAHAHLRQAALHAAGNHPAQVEGGHQQEDEQHQAEVAHLGPEVELLRRKCLEDAEGVRRGLLPQVHFPLPLVLQVEAARHVLHLGFQGFGLRIVFHQERQFERAKVGKHGCWSFAVVPGHRIGQVDLRVGLRREVAATPHHAAHPVVDVAEAERPPHHALGGAEQPPRKVVRDDRRADAALQVALREGIPLQEAEGIDAEEGRVNELHLRVEVPATVIRLDVGLLRQLPGVELCGDDFRILEVQRPILQGRVG